MAFPVTINGRTYTLADFEGTNYVDGFPDALEDFVTQAGDIYNSTSSSSVAIGTGSKTFTIADSGKPYQAGTPLRIADAAAPETNFMDCIVTSYSGTTLVVDSFGYAGSGTKTSWTVNIGGAKTVDGTLAVSQGGTGATTAAAARTALGVGTGDSPTFAGIDVTGEITANGGIALGDNDKATFGASDDLQIYHDGSNSYVQDAGSGYLVLGKQDTGTAIQNSAGQNLLITSANDVTLAYQSSAKLATTSTGIDVTGDVSIGDGSATTTRLLMGTGDDSKMFHNGTDTYWINDTGNIIIRNQSDDKDILLQTDDGAGGTTTYITVDGSGTDVSLHYGGSAKLATTSTGIDVTGTVTADGLTVDADNTTNHLNINNGLAGSNAVPQYMDISFNGYLDRQRARIRGIDRASNVTSGGLIIETGLDNTTLADRIFVDGNGDISFYEDTGTTAKFFWDASAERLGIGTTSPDAKLDVYDSSTGLSATKDLTARFYRLDGTYYPSLEIRHSTAGSHINHTYSSAASNLMFEIANTERMRIDSSGNLLVGKTTTTFATEGAVINNNGSFEVTKDGGATLFLNRKTSDGALATFYKDGTTVGSISVTSSTTTYNITSDQRLKDNITDAPSSSDDIDAIQVRSFDWKADGSHQKYGMIAQELMTVAPEAVSGDPDSDEMMGVDYSKLVPMLIKEIQSLRARVAQLETN